MRHTQIVLAIRSGMCYDKCCLRRVPQAHMEAYRSGHNEPHSKCGCPFRARGFESHRFRQRNQRVSKRPSDFFTRIGGIRTRKGTSVSENVQWTFEQRVVRRRPNGEARTADASEAKQALNPTASSRQTSLTLKSDLDRKN